MTASAVAYCSQKPFWSTKTNRSTASAPAGRRGAARLYRVRAWIVRISASTAPCSSTWPATALRARSCTRELDALPRTVARASASQLPAVASKG